MTNEEMLGLLVRLDERTERMADDVDQLKHAVLEGNGSPSLMVQVARNDERITSMEEGSKGRANLSIAWIGAAGGIGAAAITGLIELIKLIA